MTFVKICGITNSEDAANAIRLGADALGFNFYKKSSRYLSPESAEKIIEILPPHVLAVGVFVDSTAEEIIEITRRVKLQAIQLHGTDPLLPLSLPAGESQSIKIIRAIRLSPEVDKDLLEQAASIADLLLIDSFVSGEFGGTGEVTPFKKLIETIPSTLLTKTLIAGGLNPENVGEAIRAVTPFGVDVASGVEERPGKKSSSKMEKFIGEAKGKL